MLDEVALRSSDFLEGIRIKLGDGQEWSFRRPRIRLVPTRGESGFFVSKMKPAPGQGKILEEAFEAMWNLTDKAGLDMWNLRFGAAVELLRSNYNLDEDQIASLLYWDTEEEECTDRWREIDNLIRGISKNELTPATSD